MLGDRRQCRHLGRPYGISPYQYYHHTAVLLPLHTATATITSCMCCNQASLQSLLESIRVWILSYDTYMQLQMDITFIKQVYMNDELQ